MSQFAADRQHRPGQEYAGLIDELGLLSTELPDVGIPQQYERRFVNAQGRVGVLLGLGAGGEPPSRSMASWVVSPSPAWTASVIGVSARRCRWAAKSSLSVPPERVSVRVQR